MMTFASTDELKDEAMNRLKIKLGDDTDETILEVEVENAINEVMMARNYPSSYTDDMIVADVSRFFNQIMDLSLFDYNQIGIEGETTHSENGISRSFKSRNSCLRGVVPIANII